MNRNFRNKYGSGLSKVIYFIRHEYGSD